MIQRHESLSNIILMQYSLQIGFEQIYNEGAVVNVAITYDYALTLTATIDTGDEIAPMFADHCIAG